MEKGSERVFAIPEKAECGIAQNRGGNETRARSIRRPRRNLSTLSRKMKIDLPPLTVDWQVYLQLYPHFMATFRRIAKQPWYREGQWCSFVAHYAGGIFMQVFKPHWRNEQLEGIHFELACDARCLSAGIASLQLHITHKNVLPDRDRFNEASIPRFERAMQGWGPEYTLSRTKLSERVNTSFAFSASNFAEKAAKEIAQLCSLGDAIDATLAELWPPEAK